MREEASCENIIILFKTYNFIIFFYFFLFVSWRDAKFEE